jgi:hypothetical protein
MRPRLYLALWRLVRIVLVVSLLFVVYGGFTEYSLRKYLRGFSDAVVPLTATPEEKIEAILNWMRLGPARKEDLPDDFLSNRNPQDTLNYGRLLSVCGTATNAFMNLALSSGLQARRLLLLSPDRHTVHVVAEVYLDGRWIVVDPTFRTVLRDSSGHPLTREQLRDPNLLALATRGLPNYLPEYNYQTTAHVHLASIPLLGRKLRIALNRIHPDWEEDINWTLPLERKPYGLTLLAALLAGFSLLAHLLLSWRASKQSTPPGVGMGENLKRFGKVFTHIFV